MAISEAHAAAIRRERVAREAAFFGAVEAIAGINVVPLTLQLWTLLAEAESPFVCGGREPTATDIAMFVWVVSPEYSAFLASRESDSAITRAIGRTLMPFSRAKVVRRIRKAVVDETVAQIERYLETALMDAPQGSGGGECVSYWGGTAGAIGLICSAFSWSESDVYKRIPCSRLWQYAKIAQRIRDPHCILFNSSDAEIRKHLRELNKKAA